MTAPTDATIAERLSAFAADFQFEQVPEAVLDIARHLILDGVGIAFAASTFDFARRTAATMGEFEGGDVPVIGLPGRFALRDAAMINGVLIHGLDYDDTHLVGVVHATASCFPAAMAAALRHGGSGWDVLAAYVLGMEVSARLGMVARGEMNQIGFHPTGVVAAFGTTVAAGWLGGLTAEQLTMAQGVVLSMAAGTREYSTNNAGSKRLHPGWAAVCGLTAAALARKRLHRSAHRLRRPIWPLRDASRPECSYARPSGCHGGARNGLGDEPGGGEAVPGVPTQHRLHRRGCRIVA